MRYLYLIVLSSVLVNPIAADEPDDACFVCHMEMDLDQDEEDQLFVDYLKDIHVQKGFGCADCHGGNPEAYDDEDESMWDADSYLGELTAKDEIQMCGECHSDPVFMREYSVSVSVDQVTQYWTSKHGIALQQGNGKDATCTDCHGVHGILSVDNPNSSVYHFNVPLTCSKCHSSERYMAGLLSSTDQYDDYVNSVHGVALLEQKDTFAPACNDCHGNHGVSPPEIRSIKEICGSCHAQNRDLFKESQLNDIFQKEGLPQCESCHGNHRILKPTDDFLRWNTESVCVGCHETGGEAKVLASELYQIIDSLKVNLDSAKTLVEQAEIKGMEISELYFNLEDAHNALIHTRTSIHSFNSAFVRETALPGMDASEAAKVGAEKALDEFEYRRKGLFVASFIITLLVLLMYLKVRQVETLKKEELDND